MKLSTTLLIQLGVLIPTAYGAIHNLFVGNLLPPASIYSLEFNDETNDFKLLKNNTADASHAWITFNVSYLHCRTPKFQATHPLQLAR